MTKTNNHKNNTFCFILIIWTLVKNISNSEQLSVFYRLLFFCCFLQSCKIFWKIFMLKNCKFYLMFHRKLFSIIFEYERSWILEENIHNNFHCANSNLSTKKTKIVMKTFFEFLVTRWMVSNFIFKL